MSTVRVFIIEDEEHVRKTVALALKLGGYEVLEAADGEEAIAAIQSNSHWFPSPCNHLRHCVAKGERK